MNIFFVLGIPSSGYERVARVVAGQLGWQIIDVVAQVAKNLGSGVETLHIYHDEATITQQYQNCFATIINAIEKGEVDLSLVVLPADLFDNQENIALIEKIENYQGVIFDLDIKTLSRRIGLNKPRAVGLGAPRAILRNLIREKQAVWEQLNFHHIDANTDNAELLVAELKRFITNNSAIDFD